MPAPSAPQIKTQPRATPTNLEYSWNPPASDGGSPITGYFLELSGDPGFSGIAYSDAPGPNTFYYKVPGLTNAITYYTRLAASNDGGATYGPYAYFRPFQPGSKPGPPGSATATAVGASSALIEWTAGTTPDATIFWYAIISQSSNQADPVKRVTANGLTQSNYFITDLNPSSTYTFKVYSVNCPGWSAPTITNSISFAAPFGSAYFDNTTPNNSGFTISPGITVGTSEFTVECLFYIPAYPVSFQLTSGGANCLNISLNTSGDVEVTLQGVSTLTFTSPDTLTNKWTHLAIARKSGQTAVWFDGVQADAPLSDTKDYSGTILIIGSGNTIGYLTNVRVVVGSSVYNPANIFIFTPTQPLTAVTNTQLLLLEATSATLLTDSSSTQTVTNSFGTLVTWNALSPFNGPGTAVFWSAGLTNTLLATPGVSFQTNDFTIEFFFKLYTTPPSDFYPIAPEFDAGLLVTITTTNTLIVSYNGGTSPITYTLPTLQNNRWYHVAIARSGTNEAVWIDGIRTTDGIQTDSNNYTDPSRSIGSLEDAYTTNVKLQNGAALYTPSSTYIIIPPIPLSSDAQTDLLLLTTTAATLTTDTSAQQTITNQNGVTWTYLSPFGGPGSAQFDGNTAPVLAMSPGIATITTFTVEFFIWFPVAPSGEMYILGSPTGKDGYTNFLQVSLGNGTINVSQEGGNTFTYTEPTYVPRQWYHIAIVNDGTDEAVWVNGVRTTEGIQLDNNSYTGLTTYIGQTAGSGFLTATITNMRIVLSSSIYNVTNTTITVPTRTLNPAGSQLCLQTATSATLNTDASNTQTISNTSVNWCYLTPFDPQ
jgi:hypothetical protein